MSLNSSHAKWLMVPVPNEAVLILPGLAFAWAMNSATVLAGTDGFTSTTNGRSTRPATGSTSRRKLNGSVGEQTATADADARLKRTTSVRLSKALGLSVNELAAYRDAKRRKP